MDKKFNEEEVTTFSDEEKTHVHSLVQKAASGGSGIIFGEKFYALDKDKKFCVGRDNDCDLMLPGSSVSRRHALFQFTDGHFIVSDLDSQNGIVLNDQSVDADVALKHGDQVHIGTHALIFSERGMLKPDPSAIEFDEELHKSDNLFDEDPFALDKPEVPTDRALTVLPDKTQAAWKTPVLMAFVAFFVFAVGVGLYYRNQQDQQFQVVTSEDGTEIIRNIYFHRLEVNTTPIPAYIQVDGKDLGVTPLAKNVRVTREEPLVIKAVFELPQLGEYITRTTTLEPDLNLGISSLDIDGKIGVLDIKNIPDNVELYLEFSIQDQEGKVVKSFQRSQLPPRILAPFGNYTMELRRDRSIIYTRTFVLNKNQLSRTLDIKSGDLSFFPVQIHTQPEGVAIYRKQGKSLAFLGNTPFESSFPLGHYDLILKQEGYFNADVVLEGNVNQFQRIDLAMKTSKAGESILQALRYMQRQEDVEAKRSLYQALKVKPSKRETAKTHYYLGKIALNTKQKDQAVQHFNRARKHPDFEAFGLLGLARVHAIRKNESRALAIVNRVLEISNKDEHLKEADEVLKDISPIWAVMYVRSEPPGAKVIIDGKSMDRTTPVLIARLANGSRKIELHRRGYQVYKDTIQLRIGEHRRLNIQLIPVK